MDKDTQKTIETLLTQLLEKLEIEATFTLVENDGAYKINIDTADPGVLIGYHGRNLEAIQILLGQIIYKHLNTWVRIVVSVGDYRERREEQIKELAQNIAQKVVETKSPMSLEDLTPAERRIVHMTLAEHPEVMSESEGEGKYRKLVVKLRS